MNVLKNKMQRRDFLRTIAKMGLTTAFTSQFMLSSEVFAQTRTAKRFVMVYYPNGCVQRHWHSYNTGVIGANTFSTSPLQQFKNHLNKVVAIKNITLKGHGANAEHKQACRGVFSGGQMDAQTFDVTMGETLKGRVFNNLHVGLWTSTAMSIEHLPFTNKNGTKIIPSDNPQQLYDTLLADLVGDTDSNDPEIIRRKKVLESLHENLDILQAYPLNVKQQDKLLSHEEALNFYQTSLNSNIDLGNGGSGFSRPTIGMTGVESDGEAIAKAQMRNLAIAFHVDATRVGSFQFMSAEDQSIKINFPSIRPYMGDYKTEPKVTWNQTKSHPASHEELDTLNAQTHWYNMMVAYLMDELAARPDVAFGGTLLDNTLILAVSEMGGGNHQVDNAGVYVAGGAGGAIRTGMALDPGEMGLSNLYLDIAKAFGLNWGRYGNSYGSVPGFLV